MRNSFDKSMEGGGKVGKWVPHLSLQKRKYFSRPLIQSL